MKVDIIDISSIQFGERFREDYGNITELMESIKKNGLIQPLAVHDSKDGTYRLLAGGRRFKACTEVGIKQVPVRVYDGELSEEEMRVIELAENTYRLDLSWIEKAKLCKEIDTIQKRMHGLKVSTSPGADGWSLRDTAKMVGRSPAAVVQDLRIAEAIDLIPNIAECKDKKEAMKMIDKFYTDMLLAEKVKGIEEVNSKTPVEDRHRMLIDSYMIGDFFLGCKQIESETIDMCEVDPPYGIDLNAQKQLDDKSRLSLSGYNEVEAHKYEQWLRACFMELYRVMKRDSWLVVWFGPEPWFETVYQSAVKSGFTGMRIPGIWAKNRGQTMNPSLYLANTYEMFMYFRKGRPSIQKMGRSNVYRYTPVSAQTKIHPTERPIQMIQDVIDTFIQPGSTMLSPFLGSGNTLLAACNSGITCRGWDLTQEYKDRYTMRVISGTVGQYKSHTEESCEQ